MVYCQSDKQTVNILMKEKSALQKAKRNAWN